MDLQNYRNYNQNGESREQLLNVLGRLWRKQTHAKHDWGKKSFNVIPRWDECMHRYKLKTGASKIHRDCLISKAMIGNR